MGLKLFTLSLLQVLKIGLTFLFFTDSMLVLIIYVMEGVKTFEAIFYVI